MLQKFRNYKTKDIRYKESKWDYFPRYFPSLFWRTTSQNKFNLWIFDITGRKILKIEAWFICFTFFFVLRRPVRMPNFEWPSIFHKDSYPWWLGAINFVPLEILTFVLWLVVLDMTYLLNYFIDCFILLYSSISSHNKYYAPWTARLTDL